jgi:RNA polymerase subunit RPABC4/transcription elongation factor Spt4
LRCSRCGTLVSSDDSFCSNCGNKLRWRYEWYKYFNIH